jgi:hypothetical protein
MYIKRIRLKQLGPIDELVIEPRFAEGGHPVPIALVGQNGTGKSLTLAVVLDAVIEARRLAFRTIPEVSSTDFLRLSSKNYVRQAAGYSYAQVVLADEGGRIEYNEVVSRLSFDEYKEAAPDLLNLTAADREFPASGFHKHITVEDAQKQAVRNLMLLYFPYFRYEPAYWMSENAKVEFVQQISYHGQAGLNPIRTNIIQETKRWILNVLLDRELYERQHRALKLPQGGEATLFQGYSGPNTRLHNMVNEVLTEMLRRRAPSLAYARVGVGPKTRREISVFASLDGKTEMVVAPDLGQLSSGELMTLGLATEIIRAFEITRGYSPQTLSEIAGIVLVDEIDLHLHVSFQHEVLPVILSKFPGVQFLVTTHSPFFLLGMGERGDIDIFGLPVGNRIAAEEFTEFQAGYDIFVERNEQFRARYESLQEKMKNEGRPLIVTEGKTDWRHMKMALSAFRLVGDYDDLDIEFFEFDNEVKMGDTKLSQMCEYLATLPQQRTIVFVFDRDNPQIIKTMSGEPSPYKNWGNRVYSLCLPVPPHRSNYKNLTVELYYTDDALRTTDPASGKRLWFTNEIEIITRPTTGEKTYRALDQSHEHEELEKKVFDQPADQIVNAAGEYVGLSKAAFTDVIVGNAEISREFDRTAFRLLFDVIREVCRN